MAADGFQYAEALRFLAERCPGLAADPQFAAALAQDTVSAASALTLLPRALLQPEHALAVAVAFRPLLAHITGAAVDGLASGRTPAASPADAVIALTDVLAFAPFLHRSVLRGLAHLPSLESLVQLRQPQAAEQPAALPLLFAGLRLLQTAPGCQDCHLFAGLENLLLHKDTDVRWAAVECLARFHSLSDAAKRQLHEQLVGAEAALRCAHAWQQDCGRVAAYGSALWLRSPAHFGCKRRRLSPDGDTDMQDAAAAEPLAAPAGFADVCGILLPSREADAAEPPAASAPQQQQQQPLVRTPTVEAHLHAAALALCQQKPLLLEGPPGSGKSALVRELARLTGNADFVTIHMDDQIDSKTLLGAYIATARPGEFAWQPGLLTQAVVQGRWLLVEDVNLAPPDVLAALTLLLESRQLHLSQRGEVLTAAPGFQLLATVTCSPGGGGVGAYGDSQGVRNLLGGLWMAVPLAPPPLAEQLHILGASFPALLPETVAACMAVLQLCQAAGGQPGAGSTAWDATVADALAAAGLRAGELATHFGHHFSLRDLVKLCRRLQAGYPALQSRRTDAAAPALADVLKLPVSYRAGAWQECVGCFADMLVSAEARQKLLQAIAFVWGLGSDFLRDAAASRPELEASTQSVRVGRAVLPRAAATQQPGGAAPQPQRSFAQAASVMRTAEAVAAAAARNEPVLLVGETGTGKSTLVQHLADLAGSRMVALNLSQQTDSADLLGGFRPVQPGEALLPLAADFQELFAATFTRGDNAAFLARAAKLARRAKWGPLLQAFNAALAKVDELAERPEQQQLQPEEAGRPADPSPRKRKVLLSAALRRRWQAFGRRAAEAGDMLAAAEGGVAFAFVEGALVRALREGAWLLLDEINLAPPEALERIAGLLDGCSGSLVLSERGDATAIPRHPGFRLFAAMNPATDAGKRDLPAQLRQRFTEVYVPEMTAREDLRQLVAAYLRPAAPNPPLDAVVEFFLAARAQAAHKLQDSAGSRPAYSLRALARMLEYARAAAPTYGLQRALYDGGAMAFQTQLDAASAPVLERLLQEHLLGSTRAADVKAALQRTPPAPPGGSHVLFEQFWVAAGPQPPAEGSSFVVTPSVSRHLRNLARAVLLRSCPVLLQGPTSSGKTSLVAHLAACTGHACVRINNHEGTDLQEYLGSYVSDERGRLAFREGALVTALRRGQWVILDELNLAPSEVLEALNRLLDDNRELFVPELQETVRPHPRFMLFATQNPAGAYGGRKAMSRAFRSRFLELHVADIPQAELAEILHQRCSIAPSHAAKLVAVMRELQTRRQASNVFAGKHGLITPRDLFKWAGRGAVTYAELAANGYMLLAERLRLPEERALVQAVLERTLNVKLDTGALYGSEAPLPRLQQTVQQLRAAGQATAELEAQWAAVQGVVWTPSMARMFTLLDRCLEHSEPCLLVGETGTGKTTACQLAALARGQRLRVLNCNRHTEASDFLGGYRPARDRQRHLAAFQAALQAVVQSPLLSRPGVPGVPQPPSLAAPELRATAAAAAAALQAARRLADPPADEGALAALAAEVQRLAEAAAAASAPFEWVDGPLVAAMREGNVILIDELNLAEDAVLERLNSVLEAGRSLTLAEKGGGGAEEVTAAPGFRLVATMNPGGDYGKRELSPALANRFTTVWVPAFRDEAELAAILAAHVPDAGVRELVVPRLLRFWAFFQEHGGVARAALSVRDLLAWAGFVTALAPAIGALPAYAHGAHLVLLDGVGLGVAMPREAADALRAACAAFLRGQLPPELAAAAAEAAGELPDFAVRRERAGEAALWGIGPFAISARAAPVDPRSGFQFAARTVAANTMRLLRALQLRKAVLLEGSPGVGKTSLVAALAEATGRQLVRINLSEQTDMMDLLGADLPTASGEFAWADGPLLAALRAGAWVLLDELNLAGQSVLEGLNALLDHRGEVFVPELGAAFRAPPGFRVFAAQNPLAEGGGRRGLPASFLNRFTRVRVELLTAADLETVVVALHPELPRARLGRMVALLQDLHAAVNVRRRFGGAGGPWEFNLRDLLRWCRLAAAAADSTRAEEQAAAHFAHMLLEQRLRTPADRQAVRALMQAHSFPPLPPAKPACHISPSSLRLGMSALPRADGGVGPAAAALQLLNGQLPALEAAAHCVQQAWPVLLAGGQGSGKTSVVRALAALCGRPLTELCLTAGTDTSDVLGGFEQAEPRRSLQEAAARLDRAVAAAVSLLAHAPPVQVAPGAAQQPAERIARLAELSAAWRARRSAALEGDAPQLQRLQTVAAAAEAALATVAEAPGAAAARQELAAAGASLAAARETDARGRFEWVDGALTRAVEAGGWLLLDNANLCNPTVLDRLNPLLEPGGSLLLNEAGTRDSRQRLLRTHPDFRLFLAMDPRHGEVSRAMRNRCVEICLLPPEPSEPEAGAQPPSEEADLLACLAAEGVPGERLPQAMVAAHAARRTDAALRGQAATPRELRAWARLAAALGQQGWDVEEALAAAHQQVYGCPAALEAAAALAQAAAAQGPQPLLRACAWPLPLPLAAWAGDSQIASLARDASLAQELALRLAAASGTATEERLLSRSRLTPGLPASQLQACLTGASTQAQLLAEADTDALALQLWHAAGAIAERTSSGDAAAAALWATLALPSEGVAGAAAATVRECLRLCQGSPANTSLLWWALVAAAQLAAACDAAAAGSQQPASLLQQSKAAQPKAGMLSKAAHPLLGVTSPLLAALAALLLQLAQQPHAAMQAAELQAGWRLLWHFCHGSATAAAVGAPDLEQLLQPFMFHYLRLREAVRPLLAAAPQGDALFQRTADALLLTDAALSLDGPAPPLPRLWLRGGHPSLPASAELCALEQQLQALAALLACDACWESCEEESAAWPASLTAAGLQPAEGDADGTAPALLASLASHGQLRAELLSGLGLFRVAAYRVAGAPPDAGRAAGVLQLLRRRVEQIAAQVRAASPEPPASQPAAPAGVTLLPWELMASAKGRAYQGQLLPLRAHAAHTEWLATLAALTQGAVRLAAAGSAAELRQAACSTPAPEPWATALDAPRQQLQWLLSAASSEPSADLEPQAAEHLQRLWAEWHRAAAAAGSAPHAAVLGPAAAAVLAGPQACVRDGELRALQLQLAGRSLRRWCTAEGAALAASAGEAEHRALAALLAQALLVFQDSVPEPERLSAAASALLVPQQEQAGLPAALLGLLRSSSDARLLPLLDPVLAPLLDAVLASPPQEEAQAQAQRCGKAWALLGLLRLHLVMPLAGVDPAAEPQLRREAALVTRDRWLLPELQVRQRLQLLPGGPDESARLAELASEIAEADSLAEALLAQTVPRPRTSQYLALRQEVARFAGGLASVPRLTALLASLAAGGSGAAAQAEAWRQSAAAFAGRLADAFPLYRDLLLPVEQALAECSRGLALLLQAAAQQPGPALTLALDVAAFPRFKDSGLAGEAAARELTEHAARAAVRKAPPDAAGPVALEARLRTLQLLLRRALDRGAAPPTAAAAAGPLLRALLDAWEALRAAEAERAEAEASLFKTRETRIRNEEEEAEEEYKRLFPDHAAVFAEFERLPGESMDPPESQPPGEREAGSAAGQSLLRGPLLDELVGLHCRAFAGGEAAPWQEDFEAGYACAASLLEGAQPLPAAADAALAPAHTLRVALEAARLGAGPAADSGSALDVQQPCPAELRLLREPVAAAAARIRELLEEWPENPLLEQLLALCARLLELPLLAPVKAGIVGVELLVSRAQIWEQSAARHVSMAPQLDRLLQLTRRWRRLELAAWRSLLARVLAQSAAGAHASWFHLLRLLLEPQQGGQAQPQQQLGQTAATLEQFLQTAPLGEYGRRLDMLRAFGLHLAALGGRHAPVAVLVANVHAFYAQYSEAVQRAATAALAPVEKHLQDFVKLAKWEDRGHYAQRQEVEKSQRQLHKLVRDAKEALGRPAAGVLATAAAGAGLGDMADPDLEAAAADKGAGRRKPPPPPLRGWQEQAAQQAWQELCREAQAQAGAAAPAPAPEDAQPRQRSMPQLAARLSSVLAGAATGAAAPHLQGAERLDSLAGEAAQRCCELRALTGKSARSRKKKALVDFLKALAAVGVSHRRGAVPPEERAAHTWFEQEGPGEALAALLAAGSLALPGAAAAWGKAQAYHLRSMARLQRLWQAAQQPHQDVSAQEAERAARLCEHLLHLQRQQRGGLAAAARAWRTLGRLDALLAEFDEGLVAAIASQVPSVSQAAAAQLLQTQAAELARLARGTGDLVHLLEAVAAAEPAAPAADSLRAAASSLATAHSRLTGLLETARSKQAPTPAALASALTAREELASVLAGLQQAAPAHANTAPCWAAVMAEIESAAAALPAPQPSAAEPAAAVPQLLATAVDSLLVWAQGARLPEQPAGEEEQDDGRPVLELMAGLEARLAPAKLSSLADSLSQLLAGLPLTGDGAGAAAGQLSQLRALLALARGAAAGLLLQALELHRATAKLGYVATAVLAGVLQEGFCTAEEEAGDDGAGGTGAFQEAEGTGLGEGEGAKDISDQIEDEDQLLGAKQRDAPEDEAAEAPPPDDGAKGVEMEADFDGSLEDVPPDDASGSEAGEEQECERLPQEMGDVGEAGETVDERLWGGEDEREEGQQGPEKFEKNAPVQVDDKSQLEYQAGQEQEQEAPRKEQQQQQQREQPGQQPDATGAKEGEDGGEQQEEQEAGGGQEGPVNEDLPENYEDRQFAAPKEPEQELELPEDMELDADGGGMDEEAGGEEPAGEEQSQEQGGRFPEQPAGQEDGPPPGADEQQQPEPAGGEPAGEEPAGEEQEEQAPAHGAGEAAEEQPPEEAVPEGDEPHGLDPTGTGEQEEPKAGDQLPESGPAGLPAAAVEAAADQAAAAGEQAEQAEQQQGAGPMDTSMEQPDAQQQHQAGAARSSRQGDPQAGAEHTERGREQQPQPQRRLDDANPYRSLGDAFERWRAQLNVTAEAEEAAADGGAPDAPEQAEAPPAADEYGFVPEGSGAQPGEAQAAAAATEEQAAAAELPDADAAMETEQPTAAEQEEPASVEAAERLAAEASLQAGPDAGPPQPLLDPEPLGEPGEQPEQAEAEDMAGPEGAEFAGDREDSYMAALLQQQASLEERGDAEGDDDLGGELTPEEADAMRARMDEALQRAAEGGGEDNSRGEFGRQMWAQCEALTTGLAGELTEQLRLLLEPTQASRLAGDFRTGKRISMRKVVAYVASHFRKDKIWLRRTRPDKRQYQVVIAIDDSRSMRENGCGAFAMEAVTLVARALGRLEVGELAVVRFGGAAATAALHPLDRPFTDADGPRVLSRLRFDQDNTIADRPVVELVTGLGHMLQAARHRTAAGSLAPPPLHQLVLIVSDGRFHERESLRRAVAEAGDQKGVLWAFIALDSARNSLLDMQTVSFEGGKPVFSRYLDAFPFPFYMVLRDIAALPRTLADLLRQWIQLSTA